MRGTVRAVNIVLVLAAALIGLGCQGSDQGPSDTSRVIAKSPVKSGDLQSGPVGLPLGNKLQVLVTNDGVAEEHVVVSWSTNSGSVNPSSVQTNAEGLCSVTWTLGPEAGTQAATASLSGATGSPVTFTATATPATGEVATVRIVPDVR
jgi:hypothetical protein